MQRQQQNTYSPDELKEIRRLMTEEDEFTDGIASLPNELMLEVLRQTGLFGYQGFLCTSKTNATFSEPINDLAAMRRKELFDEQCFTSALHMVSPL